MIDDIPNLPWPWRACRGGRVLAANDATVMVCADRRQARAVVADTGEILARLFSDSRVSTLAHTEATWVHEFTMCVDGKTITAYADTARELADAINAAAAGYTATWDGDSGVCITLA